MKSFHRASSYRNRPYRLMHRSGQHMPRSSCPLSRQLGTAEMVEWALSRYLLQVGRSPQSLLVRGGGGGPNGAPATLSGRTTRPRLIFLIYIAREIALQDHRAEIVAEEAAHRELALLLIA